MSLHLARNYGLSGNFIPNTFIGGIAKQGGTGVNAPIDTPYKLATKLGINVNRITGFRVIGDDVECRIKGTYSFPMFGSTTLTDANQNINYYYDDDNLITTAFHPMITNCLNFTDFKLNGLISIGSYSTGGIHGATSYTPMENINLPNCILIGNVSTFRYMPNLKTIIMPKLTTVGGNGNVTNCPLIELVDWRKVKRIGHESSSVRGNCFLNSGSSNTILKVHQDITNVAVDGGGVDVNVLYAKNVRGWTVELYDDSGNYVGNL